MRQCFFSPISYILRHPKQCLKQREMSLRRHSIQSAALTTSRNEHPPPPPMMPHLIHCFSHAFVKLIQPILWNAVGGTSRWFKHFIRCRWSNSCVLSGPPCIGLLFNITAWYAIIEVSIKRYILQAYIITHLIYSKNNTIKKRDSKAVYPGKLDREHLTPPPQKSNKIW